MSNLVKRVSMQELDTRLSKIVDEARERPVAVTRYNAPWVWIVAHNVWVDIEKLKNVVPEDHPLAEVRRITDNIIQQYNRLFEDPDASQDSYMNGESMFRCLLLQSLFPMSNEERVFEELRFNLLYRWFIGIETFREPLDSRPRFISRLSNIKKDPMVIGLLLRCLDEIRKNDEINKSFSIDSKKLQKWQECLLENDEFKK